MIYLSTGVMPNAKREYIQIKCGMHENTLPQNAPSRKFHKPSSTWRLPIVRLNIEYLRRNRDRYEGSDEFWNLLNTYGADENLIKVNDFPVDYPFKTQPRPHQLKALRLYYRIRNPGMFMDIGTGKSKVAIDTASCRYYEGDISKVIVVCLVSIKDNWVDEINKHSPINCVTHILETTKAGKNRYKSFKEEDGFRWLIVGIESFSNGSAFDLCMDFVDDETMVIIDESDSIKNHSAKRTERAIELAEDCVYKMIMTGTPLLQGIVDLYSQFEFLDPDIIGVGDYYSFRNRYAVMGGHNNREIIGYQRVEELTGILSPYVYQVRKREVLKDLPPATYQTYMVDMSAEQKKIYGDLKKHLRMVYEGKTLSVKATINLMQRFSEITGGFFSYVDEEVMSKVSTTEKVKIKYKKEYLKTNPKAVELLRIVEALPNDEPVIIWAISKMEVAYLTDLFRKKFGSGSVAEMHGGVGREDRTINLKNFESGIHRFLIGNPTVGGIGLNMTSAAIMIYFGNDFSLRTRLQSEGRIERIGQTRPMLYIDIMCRGSIDTYIRKAVVNKQDFAEVIRAAFDSGELEDLV